MRRQCSQIVSEIHFTLLWRGGIVLLSGLGVLVHALIRSLPQRWNVAILLSKSHIELQAMQRNRSGSSVLSRVQRFPPNASRGERCGVWGRIAPSKPVRFTHSNRRNASKRTPKMGLYNPAKATKIQVQAMRFIAKALTAEYAKTTPQIQCSSV
jgi:hypothetical protein